MPPRRRYERITEEYEIVDDTVLAEPISEDEEAVDDNIEVVEDEAVIAKPKPQQRQDFIVALWKAYKTAKSLIEVRRQLKNALSYTATSNEKIRTRALIIARQLEKEERRLSKEMTARRKALRRLCKERYKEPHYCEKCPYNWLCWKPLRI